jgi:hypothetical protein
MSAIKDFLVVAMSAIKDFLVTLCLFLTMGATLVAVTIGLSIATLTVIYIFTHVCILRVAWCSL